MAKLFSLARMTTATTGTGTITLGSAVAGWMSFANSGVSDGDIIGYAINDGSNSEIGTGTYTSSGTTLTRSVIRSTNSNAAISLSGSAEVFVTPSHVDLDAGYSLGPTNVSLAFSASGGALTIALKDQNGNDHSANSQAIIPFRSSTATSGNTTYRNNSAALSLTISSGSTLGVSSTTAFRIWVVIFDDAGTLRLGAIQCANSAGVFPLRDGKLYSSTAEGGAGAADSAKVIYTGTAVTSKPCRILGYGQWSASGLTAGTWTTTNLEAVQMFAPGVPTPGSVIQTVYGTTATSATNSTSTLADSNLTASITMDAAANLVNVAIAQTEILTSGSTIAAKLSTLRGASVICQNALTIGYNVTGGGIITSYAATMLDVPNSASALTYKTQFANAGSGTITVQNNNSTSNMLLQEIMA